MKITVTHDDGTTVDITEPVQVAYDAVRQSLDWGSGFLDTEEVDSIVRLAVACRFPDFEEAIEEVARRRTGLPTSGRLHTLDEEISLRDAVSVYREQLGVKEN